jgi:hypothetical protein
MKKYKMNYKSLIFLLFCVVCAFVFCKEIKPKEIESKEFKELIGKDYNEFKTNLIKLKDKCSLWEYFDKGIETDSNVTFIYLSNGKCHYGEYKILVNKKTNKITELKETWQTGIHEYK